jgi:hypothetical protein
LGKLYYNRQGITADSALVPESLSSAFSPIASLKEFWSNTIGVGAGLGCVIPISDSFDFGFDATLGGGFQRQTHVFADRESVAYTFAQEMNAKMYTKGEFGKHAVEADIYMDMLSSKVDDLNLDATSVGTKVVYTYTGF